MTEFIFFLCLFLPLYLYSIVFIPLCISVSALELPLVSCWICLHICLNFNLLYLCLCLNLPACLCLNLSISLCSCFYICVLIFVSLFDCHYFYVFKFVFIFLSVFDCVFSLVLSDFFCIYFSGSDIVSTFLCLIQNCLHF